MKTMAATAKKTKRKLSLADGKDCQCIEAVNKRLAEHNAMIDTKLYINFKTGKARALAYVPTRRIDDKKRTKLPTVSCSFCPFCGKKQF